jgi:hypothetical protein
MVVQSLQRTALERAKQNERVMAEYNDHPPYSEAELLATGLTCEANQHRPEIRIRASLADLILDGVQIVDAPPSKNAVSAVTSVNPLRVTCPLCRRLKTVVRVEGSGDAYRCNYSGCFSYTWDEVREFIPRARK